MVPRGRLVVFFLQVRTAEIACKCSLGHVNGGEEEEGLPLFRGVCFLVLCFEICKPEWDVGGMGGMTGPLTQTHTPTHPPGL